MKVSSNTSAAKEAVAGFAGIGRGQRARDATLTASTVPGMRDGAEVANAIVDCIDRLLVAVRAQAGRVTALATEIEERDAHDARRWGEKP